MSGESCLVYTPAPASATSPSCAPALCPATTHPLDAPSRVAAPIPTWLHGSPASLINVHLGMPASRPEQRLCPAVQTEAVRGQHPTAAMPASRAVTKRQEPKQRGQPRLFQSSTLLRAKGSRTNNNTEMTGSLAACPAKQDMRSPYKTGCT